jgi:hypothetical protein
LFYFFLVLLCEYIKKANGDWRRILFTVDTTLYATAGLAIRPKTQVNRIEQLKEIIRAWGANPEEILSKDALLRGNITETQDQTQNHQLSILAKNLKQIIRKEATE